MKNPFKKRMTQEESDRKQAEEYAEENQDEGLRQERLHKQKIGFVKREEKQKQELRYARQDAMEEARRESLPPRHSRFGRAGSAAYKLAGGIQRADKKGTYSRRRIRYVRGTKKVVVSGQSPIPEPEAFDNRFSHLFNINSSNYKIGQTGRDYSKLMSLGKKKRIW